MKALFALVLLQGAAAWSGPWSPRHSMAPPLRRLSGRELPLSAASGDEDDAFAPLDAATPPPAQSTSSSSAADIEAKGVRRRMGGRSKGVIKTPDGDDICVIKVVGVGGGGGNAVNRMMETNIQGVEFWAFNTDSQALSKANTDFTLNIGRKATRGLGAGGDPSVGARAADESREEIANVVRGSDLVFVTAGMGGGTGSGAAPVVAEVAKDLGALTVGVVTKPFGFEGRKRMQQANDAIAELQSKVDTLIVVSNDKLLQIVPENTPLSDAFLVADDILRQGVVGISEIIVQPGLINVDFADVRAVMGNAGTALMGIGTGKGKTRAQDAAVAAISSPLLDFPIKKAKGIVFNIVGGSDLSIQEITQASKVIYENVDENANIIFGALVDKSMESEVSITVLATGFSMGVKELVGAVDGSAEIDIASPPKKQMRGTDLPPPLLKPPPSAQEKKGMGGFFRRLTRD